MLATAGCATRPPADIHGRWVPVNRYAASAQAIPLRAAYVYYATPLDRTLKGMLDRWARDMRLQLVYAHDADFTLPQAVADVRSDDLHAAAAQLSRIYASQQVEVAVEGDRLLVRRTQPGPAQP